MKIKTQISISLLIFALLAGVIIFSVVSSNNHLAEIQKKQQIIDNIARSSFELYYLENDYLVHGGTIPVERWNVKYEELTGQLQSLTLTDPSQQVILDRMFDDQKNLKSSFFNLVSVNGGRLETESTHASQELKEFSASTLAGQTQTLMSSSSELSQMVKAEAREVGQRTIIIISFSIALLMIFVLLNYLVIYRSVLKSISALQKGTEHIGSGDLDTKIEITSTDELGYLSQTFNDMASSLKNSHSLLLASKAGLEQEIMEHKKTEEALRERDSQIRALIDNLPFDTWAMDASGHYILQNPVSKELWGDFIGNTTPRIPVPAYLIEHWQENNHKVLKGTSVRGELSVSSENGVRIYDEIVAPIRKGDEIRGIIGVNIDITERKAVQDALITSEEKFRGIFDNINDGLQIHEIGPDGKPGKFIEANNVACQMLQYTRDELMVLGPLDFATEYHSKPLNEIFKENMTTGHAIFETGHRRKDGTIIPVEINTHVVNLMGKRVIVAVVRDITERKAAQDALMRVNQKLNVISQLTRKDLANQIFVLNSYLELAKHQLAGQDHIIETVQKGVRAIQSIHETIEYSKDYQDMGSKPPAWQNVKMALLFGLSHISIGKIQHSFETEYLEIFADPLLEKVCQRLFENAVKHGEHVTRIRVWYTVTKEGAVIFFEDDGIGISEDRKKQIFLRSEGARVSVRSLIFVREILDITGITIKETGEPGKGARFEMVVPKGMWRTTNKGT